MMLVDANLLLYAYHPRSKVHEASRAWLESAFSGRELVRIAWMTVFAFLRISTNPHVFERPLSTDEASAIVSSWLTQPSVEPLEPGDRYWEIFQSVMRDGQATGPLVMDAALAALAIEHGATLQTTDKDFARFSGLKWVNPLTS